MKLGEITSSLSLNGKDYTSQINSINTNINQDKENHGQNQNGSFSSVLKNSIEEVNNTQVKAYDAMEEIASGKVENLQEAVQRIEEAELSLKLGLEVKNKALGAYKQVMSMQI